MRPRAVALPPLLFLLISANSPAQVNLAESKPANLGFDEGETGTKPRGWHTVSNWTLAEVRRGAGCRKGGCLTLTRPDPPPANSFGNVMQSLDAKPYAGKRVIYRAAVRVESGGPADAAMLWFRVDLPGQAMGFFDNMQDRPIRGGDWAVYEIKGDVALDAVRINFGIMAHGKARVWVDDVSLETVATVSEGPEVAAAREAIAKQYRRLDEAQSAGRFDEILAVALPDARAGSFVMKVPIREYVESAKRAMSGPGMSATIKTQITEVKLTGAEATVRTRTDGTITTAGKTRTMQGASQDVWVRQAAGEWLLKEAAIVSQREVPASLDPEAVKRVASAIAAQAAPLTTAQAGAPRNDLAAFGKAVGAARIVSLGEATHGSREIFQMKHRLLEYLVREKGFTVFAIEANWPESQAADRYIKTGEGDPRQALRDMYFWTWQTEEVLAMLEWMRAFNQGPGDHPVLSFTAFDMQTYSVAATRVTAFARQHAAVGGDLAATVEAAYRGLNALPGNARPDPAFRPAAEQAHKVTALLESRREALVKAAGAAAFRDALQMARTVEQATTLLSPPASPSYRDEMMAKNIEWLAQEAHPGEKIVVWAHNGHISTSADGLYQPMGSWLRQRFRRQMYVAGFAIHTGSVRAIGAGARRTGLATHAIPAAPASSGSAVLSAAGSPIFFLDFAAARGATGPLDEWLRSRHSFRECGAIWNIDDAAEGNMRTTALAESYDGLIFIEKTEAAKGLN